MMFTSEAATYATQSVCAAVTPRCSNGEYSSVGPTKTSDRVCTKCEGCGPGLVRSNCGGTSAGECVPCGDGAYEKDGSCQKCEGCGAGFVLRGCAGASRGQCVACPSHTYKLGKGSWDEQCASCAPCSPGQMRVGCGGSSPGQCVGCPVGTFRTALPFESVCVKPAFLTSQNLIATVADADFGVCKVNSIGDALKVQMNEVLVVTGLNAAVDCGTVAYKVLAPGKIERCAGLGCVAAKLKPVSIMQRGTSRFASMDADGNVFFETIREGASFASLATFCHAELEGGYAYIGGSGDAFGAAMSLVGTSLKVAEASAHSLLKLAPSDAFTTTGCVLGVQSCRGCEGCEAGFERRGCGKGSGGVCAKCPSGTFKASSGSWDTKCAQCGACQAGFERVGCGGDSEGECVKCPSRTFEYKGKCEECGECWI